MRVLGVKATNNSTLTVEVNGQTRTFKDGDGITFPRNVGGKRSLKEMKSFCVGDDADNVRYDAKADEVYVSYGGTNGGEPLSRIAGQGGVFQ